MYSCISDRALLGLSFRTSKLSHLVLIYVPHPNACVRVCGCVLVNKRRSLNYCFIKQTDQNRLLLFVMQGRDSRIRAVYSNWKRTVRDEIEQPFTYSFVGIVSWNLFVCIILETAPCLGTLMVEKKNDFLPLQKKKNFRPHDLLVWPTCNPKPQQILSGNKNVLKTHEIEVHH